MKRLIPLFAVVAVLTFLAFLKAQPEKNTPVEQTIAKAQKLIGEGLHKDALDILQPFVLDAESDAASQRAQVPRAIELTIQCLNNLNRVSEADEFLEKAVEVHADDWRSLHQIGLCYRSLTSHGVIVDGKFQRGGQDGQGKRAESRQRDRVRALQLYVKAASLAEQDDNKNQVASFFYGFAHAVLSEKQGGWSWKLQSLTDLAVLPDYDEGYWNRGDYRDGAPVDLEGNPIFYGVPESFEAAKNDGERWRWCLQQAVENDPRHYTWRTLQERAQFCQSQFGEQTLQSFPFFQSRQADDETDRQASIWSLENLSDDETITKLATGIKRFKLPDDQNYIKLYKQAYEEAGGNWLPGKAIARIYENRRQYVKAAECWQKLIDKYPSHKDQIKNWTEQRNQIVGNWGRLDPTRSEVAGTKATLGYVFRNGSKVKLTAHEIKIPELLNDIKTYLKSKPKELDWSRTSVEQIGYQLVFGRGDKEKAPEIRKKYLGKQVADWAIDLKPAEKHFDRKTSISVPIEQAGAYLVKTEMEGGNTEHVVLWLNDTAIVQKRMLGSNLYFLADAGTGQPVADMPLDFFGYRTEWKSEQRPGGRQRQADRMEWFFDEFERKTDENGLSYFQSGEKQARFNWLVMTKDPKSGRFAYLGFNNIWYGNYYDAQYNQVKTFFISDRPVYRPGDKVEMKVWVGTAKYDLGETNEWAGKTIGYDIFDPKGEKIVEKTDVKLDEYGGAVFELELPKDATLGSYSFNVRGIGGYGNFRVEEYKKPEYEVTVDAPKEPVRLGEKITAKITAKYYFGSPVTEATVKYKVLREKYDETWYPWRPWDWFYGNGYGWFAYDSDWLPGWRRWGVCRPMPSWFVRPYGPPEVVAEQEVKIGEDGTVDLEIDSSLAEAMFPGQSQKYSITAEVVDNSRRTIVGSGNVLVSKEPFKIYAWVDRGYFEPGQKIEAGFQARRLDGKPVSGDAEVKVFRINYKKSDNKPDVEAVETEVHTAVVKFDDEGKANLSLNAAGAGQYRISCRKLALPEHGLEFNGSPEDVKKFLDSHTQEGGYVFNVYDNLGYAQMAETPTNFWKFNALELIPDKAEFKPGENVALRVNSDRQDAFVLLFVKAANGVCVKPQILHLIGKSNKVTIPVEMRDMPNFFVEAMLVSDGKVVTETREIVIPPEKRILNVDVKPSSENYKPGEKAKAELIVTDMDGNPVVGQTVVSIYDKSVEYISGGSNVADIKEFFWKWRRSHHPQSVSNLEKYFGNMQEPNKPGMQPIGVFGHVVDHNNENGQINNLSFNGVAVRRSQRSRFMNAAPRIVMEEAEMDAPMSMAAAAPMMKSVSVPDGGTVLLGGIARNAEAAGPGGGTVEPTIRQNFADTALWVGALETDENGLTTVELDMPESLTTWKINVWSMAPGTRVGYGSTEVITRKDLIIRMQTPRFLIEKDKCIFSANVHNYLENEKQVDVSLELDDKIVIPTKEVMGHVSMPSGSGVPSHATKMLAPVSLPIQRITIPAGGEKRVDWLVEAKIAGEPTVTMKALTDEESDAMRKTLPVYVHGMMKQEAWSGYIAPDKESGSIEVKIPEERKPEQTKLTVRFSPTLAASMVDALPYLVDYPYGCTEQTLNRFLPTVITQKILIDMNVDLTKLKDLKTNLNAQELGEGRKPAVSRMLEKRKVEPVFDVDEVREMVKDGITKLTNMQCSDGGWGWFGGSGEHSSPHLTALVVHGLKLAQQNDVAIDNDVLLRGFEWLLKYQKEQVELLKNALLSEEEKKTKRWKSQADEIDAFVLMVLTSEWKPRPPQAAAQDKNHLGHAIGKALFGNSIGEAMDEIDLPFVAMKEFLWRDRAKLSLYGVAMYGIALTHSDDKEKAAACVKMLEQYLEQDEENQTAWLNLRGSSSWYWWCWHGSEFETQAYYLKLLMRTDPKSPVAPRLVKYLLNNRRHATYWNSTRDTAICIEAFAEFIKATGEDKPNMTVEVLFDGQVKKTVAITPENLFEIDNTLILNADEISSGNHKVELRKKGEGPLYFNAYLENFTLEDPIEKAGLEVKIERRIYRLDRDESATTQAAGGRGQVLDLKVEKYTRTPISEFKSGDLVEIELVIESKNDYESIIIEDMKAAGLEPVDVRSGYNGNELGAYVEFRDERVAFFVYRLAKDKHSVSYRLRAEQPGEFSALPAKIEAMYAPELKGNSDENKVKVVDRQE